MSAIANNAEAGAKGVFNLVSGGGDDTFKETVTQALALKLNLKTNQQANERALLNLLKSKGSTANLKQTLQSRAAIYGNSLDPSWFCKNYALSAKLIDLQRRRMARSLLAAAPLFSAQVGAQEIRKELSTRDDDVFDRMGLATRGTVGEFIKAIGKMSPLGILRMTDKKR